MLKEAVAEYGNTSWILIQQHVPGRTDVQCRERYCNVVDPMISREKWTEQEDQNLLEAVKLIGAGNWAQVRCAAHAFFASCFLPLPKCFHRVRD